jgi:Spy/CpxP family protein refolding chaperone
MMRGRLRAALVIGAIVVASILVGAAIDRSFLARPRRPRGPGANATPEQEARRRQEGLDRMTRDLGLSPAQRASIDTIMQRTDSSLRIIRREMQPRIEQVFDRSRADIGAKLDSAQRQKFEKTIAKRRPPR